MSGPDGLKETEDGLLPPESKRDPATADAVLRPFRGGPLFRRRASLRVLNGELIVNGRWGEEARFSLVDEGKPYALADTLDDLAVVDREGRALLITSRTCWDADEAKKFAAAAGLWSYLGPDSTPPPLGDNGIRLRTGLLREAAALWAFPAAALLFAALRGWKGPWPQGLTNRESLVFVLGLLVAVVLMMLAAWAGRTSQRHRLEIVDGAMVIRSERGEVVDRIPLNRAGKVELGMELKGAFDVDIVGADGTPVNPNASDIHLNETALLDLTDRTGLPLVMDPDKDPFLTIDPPCRVLHHPHDRAERGLTLRVERNVLLIADRGQEIARYRLDGQPGSPAALVELCGRNDVALIDTNGRALFAFPGDFWWRYDLLSFATAAKLPFEIRDGRRGARRLELAPTGVGYGAQSAAGNSWPPPQPPR